MNIPMGKIRTLPGTLLACAFVVFTAACPAQAATDGPGKAVPDNVDSCKGLVGKARQLCQQDARHDTNRKNGDDAQPGHARGDHGPGFEHPGSAAPINP